jgi:hypothetical protein
VRDVREGEAMSGARKDGAGSTDALSKALRMAEAAAEVGEDLGIEAPRTGDASPGPYGRAGSAFDEDNVPMPRTSEPKGDPYCESGACPHCAEHMRKVSETPSPDDADLARRFWQRFYAIDVHRNDRPHEDVTIPLVLDLIAEVRCHALDNPEPVRPTATAPGVRADMPPLQPGDIVVATKGMRMGEIGTVVRYECDAPNGERQYRVEYHGVRECLTLEPFLLRVTNRLPNVPPLTCLECEESSNTRSPREMTCCAGCYAVLESRLTALLEAGAGRERPTNELEDLRVAFRSMTQQLDAIIPAAMAVLRDARDEGRADCRDSVDEEHIERLRQSIYAKYPKAEPADCASPTKENETCTESQASLTGSSSRPVPADTASSVTRSEWDASAADARSTPPTSEAADSSGPVTSFEGLEIQGETDVLLYIRVPKKRWQAFQEWERTANPLPKEK